MIPPSFPPPRLQAPAPTMTLSKAVEEVMQDFDAEDRALPLRDPQVAPSDKPSLRWLRSAALSELPDNSFPKGTPSSAEAEALISLLKASRGQAEAMLPRLSVQEPGTALALWRWAKRQERIKIWDPAVRRMWEDKLLARNVPYQVNGYALRHGLCWALAEKDEARFAALKAGWAQDAPSLLASFQGLFGQLGAISPELRLWTLPGLAYQDRRLDRLSSFHGGRPDKIWISPDIDPDGASGSVAGIPAHTAWILPSATGSQNIQETNLSGLEKSAGAALALRLADMNGQAYFAPSRAEFEALGLVFFPILIDLDSNGAIQEIRMGDAAPREP